MTDDEFLALRRRAYGPDADLHDDPVALGRLHELEKRREHDDSAPQRETPSQPVMVPDGESGLIEEDVHPGRGNHALAQLGATQVASLSVDTSYETPGFFASEGRNDILGFGLFHGLRAVVSKTGFFASGGSDDECLSVFAETDMLAATSNGFSGLALGGCAAGTFPAIVQFRSDMKGSPDELGSAFPNPTGLQFVYDQASKEVVVFAGAD